MRSFRGFYQYNFNRTVYYLKDDKYAALTDWILRQYGYEVPLDFDWPSVIKHHRDDCWLISNPVK